MKSLVMLRDRFTLALLFSEFLALSSRGQSSVSLGLISMSLVSVPLVNSALMLSRISSVMSLALDDLLFRVAI